MAKVSKQERAYWSLHVAAGKVLWQAAPPALISVLSYGGFTIPKIKAPNCTHLAMTYHFVSNITTNAIFDEIHQVFIYH